MSKIEVDEIVAKRITVKGDEHEIVLQVTGGMPGIWIQKIGESVPCVCIYMQNGKPVVGVHSKESVHVGCAAALSVDDKGDGIWQMVKGGEINHAEV